MGIKNDNLNTTGLVQRYVGTAYDKMAALSDNLEAFLKIYESIEDGSFDEVADISDEIQSVIDKIEEFNGIYYGALPAEPPTDPYGNAINNGDLYYDTLRQLLMVYQDTFWLPLGAVNHTVERIIVGPNHIQNNRVEITLTQPYLPGTNNLAVHRNRVINGGTENDPVDFEASTILVSKSNYPDHGDYEEVDEVTVYLDNTTHLDDELVFHVGTEAATITHIGEVGRYYYKTIVNNESVITLPEGVTYVKGSNNLTVHAKRTDGLQTMELQLLGIDYLEEGPNRIQFLDPLPQGSEVQMTIGHIVANDEDRFRIEMSAFAPNPEDYEEGQLWFKTDVGRMYILYEDLVPDGGQLKQWVGISNEDYSVPEDYVAPPAPKDPVIHGTVFQTVRPDPAKFSQGTLWFNENTGALHINYYDGDSHQWVKVST